jgi:hypothetical protein
MGFNMGFKGLKKVKDAFVKGIRNERFGGLKLINGGQRGSMWPQNYTSCW